MLSSGRYKLELTSAETRLELDECIMLAKDINASAGTEIAACMPLLKEEMEDEHGL